MNLKQLMSSRQKLQIIKIRLFPLRMPYKGSPKKEKYRLLVIKKPDLYIIEKMISTTEKLNAIVVCEEEIYDNDFIFRVRKN